MAGYGSDDGFATWASDNGYTVPSGTVATARQRGSVYIDGAYDARFPGYPTGGVSQERAWPRTDAEDRYGNAIGINDIPDRVVQASYEAALLELTTPGSLTTAIAPGKVRKRVKVEGAVEVEYAVNSVGRDAVMEQQVMSTRIEGLLYPLLTVKNLPGALIV